MKMSNDSKYHYYLCIGLVVLIPLSIFYELSRRYQLYKRHKYGNITIQSFYDTNMKPEVVLYGVQTESISKLVDDLCGKGAFIFTILKVMKAFPDEKKENSLDNKFIITLGLSSALCVKLNSIFHRKANENEETKSSMRNRICQKVSSIVKRLGIQFSRCELLHTEMGLSDNHNLTNIHFYETIKLIDYFGSSTSYYFMWIQYVYFCTIPFSALYVYIFLTSKVDLYPLLCTVHILFLSCSFAYFRHKIEHFFTTQSLRPIGDTVDTNFANLVGKPLTSALTKVLKTGSSWLLNLVVTRVYIALAYHVRFVFSLLSPSDNSAMHFMLQMLSAVVYYFITYFMICLLENLLLKKIILFENHDMAIDAKHSLVVKKVKYVVSIFVAWILPIYCRSSLGTSVPEDMPKALWERSDLASRKEYLHNYLEVSILLILVSHIVFARKIKDMSVKYYRGDYDSSSLMAFKPLVAHCLLSRKHSHVKEQVLGSSAEVDDESQGPATDLSHIKKTTGGPINKKAGFKNIHKSSDYQHPHQTEVSVIRSKANTIADGQKLKRSLNTVYFDNRFVREDDISTNATSTQLKRDVMSSVNAAQNVLIEVDKGKDIKGFAVTHKENRSPILEYQNEHFFDEKIAESAAKHDFEVIQLTSQDKVLLYEMTKKTFEIDQKQTKFLSVLTICMFFAPFSPLIFPLLTIYAFYEYKANIIELVMECRRPIIDDHKSMEPWLFWAERISIFSIVTSLFIFYMNGQLWTESYVPLPSIAIQTWVFIQNLALPLSVERITSDSFADFKIHSYIILIVIEHFILLFRIHWLPIILQLTAGYHAKALLNLGRLLELRENATLRLLFWQTDDIKNAITRIVEQNDQFVKLHSMMTLAKIQTQIGNSMNGYLWASLAMTPFVLNHFHLSASYTLVPYALVCFYHQYKVDRQKRGIAMSMICDPIVHQFVKSELPAFTIDPDMQRCEWVNTMLHLTWPQMSEYGARKVRKILEPDLEKNCPSIAKKLSLSKLTMGTKPFTILGMKVLNGKLTNDYVDLDVDFKWVSDMAQHVFNVVKKLSPIRRLITAKQHFLKNHSLILQ